MSRTGCTPSTLSAQVKAAAAKVQELRGRLHDLQQQLLAKGSTPQADLRRTMDQVYETADALARAEIVLENFQDS